MNGLSLFSGIGGLDLGLERAGITTVGQVEIDPWCRRVLAKHWPDVPRHDDVRTAADWWQSEERPRVDLVFGGFPCQDISNAGKRSGIDGERSGLWSEFHDLIRVLRPRWVLLENVAAILARGAGRVFGDLAEIGYDAEWDCVPAASVGAPHLRDRWFAVAYPQRDQLRLEPEPVTRGRGTAVAGVVGPQWPLANADGTSRSGQGGAGLEVLQSGPVKRPGRRGGCGWADALADPESGERDTQESEGVETSGRGAAEPGERRSGSGSGDGRRATQPGLGEYAYGVPAGLDGAGLGADAAQAGPGEVLPGVRVPDGAHALRERPAGGPLGVPSPRVLRPGVHEGGLCQRHVAARFQAETGQAVPWDLLRVVWGYDQTARPPHRRELGQRLAVKHPDLVRLLSRHAPPPCPACWADGSWEDGLPRVAKGIADRNARLKGIGNAVVPQVAEHIGRLIVAADRAAA